MGIIASNYNANNERAIVLHDVEKNGDPNILEVDGYSVDIVENVFPISSNLYLNATSMRDYFKSLFHNVTSQETSINPNRLLRVLIGDTFGKRHLRVTDELLNDFLEMLLEDGIQTADDPDISRPSRSKNYTRSRDARALLDWFEYTCCGRAVFTTRNNVLGLGPSGLDHQCAQRGDIVSVLFGGRWPFLLRKKGDYYRLIGESYVEGIMNGEAVIDHERRETNVKTFRIK